MTRTRAAAYFGCSAILLAALASAGGIGERAGAPPPEPQPVRSTGTETLADDVQANTERLKARLAAAPSPPRAVRNPFAFKNGPMPTSRRPGAVAQAAVLPAPVVHPEPVLTLAGIASDLTPDGPVRTAIITAEGGELFMLKTGEFLGARYRVESIGADAVELSDRTTGAIRRLALR